MNDSADFAWPDPADFAWPDEEQIQSSECHVPDREILQDPHVMARVHSTGRDNSCRLDDDQIDAIREAIDNLPPKYREAIEALFYGPEIGDETAERLGVARSTVYHRRDQALALLGEQVAIAAMRDRDLA